MSPAGVAGADAGHRRFVVTGLGGQGVLFLARVLAEAAIAAGRPVITSETHGMAQRGGVVIAHVKVGPFASPLVRAGSADGVLVLAAETLPLASSFLAPGGWAVADAPAAPDAARGTRLFLFEAAAAARAAGRPGAANLTLLGFALARAGPGALGGIPFAVEEIRGVLRRRQGAAGAVLAASLAALDAGFAAGAQGQPGRCRPC